MPPFKFVAPVATAVLSCVIAFGALVPGAPAHAAPTTNVVAVSCTYVVHPDERADVTVSVRWRGIDPESFNAPIQVGEYPTSTSIFLTREQKIANQATEVFDVSLAWGLPQRVEIGVNYPGDYEPASWVGPFPCTEQ